MKRVIRSVLEILNSSWNAICHDNRGSPSMPDGCLLFGPDDPIPFGHHDMMLARDAEIFLGSTSHEARERSGLNKVLVVIGSENSGKTTATLKCFSLLMKKFEILELIWISRLDENNYLEIAQLLETPNLCRVIVFDEAVGKLDISDFDWELKTIVNIGLAINEGARVVLIERQRPDHNLERHLRDYVGYVKYYYHQPAKITDAMFHRTSADSGGIYDDMRIAGESSETFHRRLHSDEIVDLSAYARSLPDVTTEIIVRLAWDEIPVWIGGSRLHGLSAVWAILDAMKNQERIDANVPDLELQVIRFLSDLVQVSDIFLLTHFAPSGGGVAGSLEEKLAGLLDGSVPDPERTARDFMKMCFRIRFDFDKDNPLMHLKLPEAKAAKSSKVAKCIASLLYKKDAVLDYDPPTDNYDEAKKDLHDQLSMNPFQVVLFTRPTSQTNDDASSQPSGRVWRHAVVVELTG
ncbi:hypothetical protein [Yoonia sp. R2-816]|uniref:hypothetical protein n=1 Tax=Yoonia sp. R2-816 TaxID=3342638 RepID=UPI003726A9E9